MENGRPGQAVTPPARQPPAERPPAPPGSGGFRVLSLVERLVIPPGGPRDQARKQVVLFLCCAILLFPLLAFGIQDWFAGRKIEGGLCLVFAGGLIAALLLVRRARAMTLVPRALALMALALICYLLAVGGGDGFAFVWFFVFPPSVLFIMGQREGTCFVALSILAAVFFMILWPASSVYYESSAPRFLIGYVIVFVVSYGIESSRRRYQLAIQREKRSLQEALDRVKTLEKLLPICSWCKRIRDEEQTWSELEHYFHQHGDLRFTHGICPECEKRVMGEE